jgi:release factor glutamine methyltransferase
VAGVRVADAVAKAAGELLDAGVAAPRVDAELLAAHVLGVPRGRLAVVDDFPAAEELRFRDLVRARSSRVPLQHLTGVAPFRHLELAVGPGAFVPRPETELLVEWGLQWLRTHSANRSAPPIVVDLCAGPGPIAASVATEEPQAAVYAVEREPIAVGWLRRNVSERGVTVVKGDATKPETLSELDGRVDLVLCNPPYVPEIGSAGLPPEVSEHDPHNAVFGGTDGLDVIRPLIGRLAALLRPGGAFAVEHDDTHAYVVPILVDSDGRFTDIELHHDLARRPRFTTATRTG